jgi:hypothetical protein
VTNRRPDPPGTRRACCRSGNQAQGTARLLGIKIPAIPVEHQYIVSEPDPT